jgi:tetratricopeptide (TPR) repeat protein
MKRCLNKVVFYILFFNLIAASGAYASPDSLTLPPYLVKKLAKFREKDDLEYWIYERMMYVEKDPPARINFLMRSQREAWRTYKTYYERLAWFDLLSVQGYYQLQTGNIPGSINAYEAALSFYESYPLPDADIIETVLKPLGNNYTRLSDYNTALFIHHKTMALAQKTNNAGLIASTYSNMAICAHSQDDLPAATAYCQAGLHYASPGTALFGLLLSTEAAILLTQQRYDSAETICRSALQLLQQYQHKTPALNWYTGALQVAAKIAGQKKQYNQAASYAKQAAQILNTYFPLTRLREKAKLQVLLGDILLKTGNYDRSLQYYQQALLLLLPRWKPRKMDAVPAAAQLYGENTLTDALFGKATALTQLHQPQRALQHYISALAAAGRLRQELFYTESKLKEITDNRSHVEAATKLAYNQWKATNDKQYLQQLLLIAEMSRAQVLMDERRSRMEVPNTYSTGDTLMQHAKHLQQAIVYYQHELLQANDKNAMSGLLQQAEYDLSLLNKKIKQQTFTRNDTNALTIQTLNNMMQRLPAHVTMLEFVAGKDSSFIIELTGKGIQSIQLIDPVLTNIPGFMHHWFLNGPSAMMNQPQDFYKECYALYHAIFKTRSWKKEQQYILIPDGAFNYLPFDALLTSPAYGNNVSQWPYLFKQAVLSQAYSLATWFQQQTTQYPSTAFTGFFVSKGKQTQQPALDIEAEYQDLNKKIAGQFYTNATATWNAFNAISNSTGILHISTHSVSAASDSFPYLQLYDRPFYLFDLRYKHFSPALVVLSACKTADGSPLAGEGLNSISRGFTAAGAGGVISSLWNVNDQTAIALMQRFYDQLVQQPNISLALYQAKKQWLLHEKENPLMQLPYYWAGFVYSGHLQKVRVQPAPVSHFSYWWLAPLVLIPAVWMAFNMYNSYTLSRKTLK